MRPWRADISTNGPGSNAPFSHETKEKKSTANAGISIAAALIGGARLVRPRVRNAVERESVLSRSSVELVSGETSETVAESRSKDRATRVTRLVVVRLAVANRASAYGWCRSQRRDERDDGIGCSEEGADGSASPRGRGLPPIHFLGGNQGG